jgi:hypothetical protein
VNEVDGRESAREEERERLKEKKRVLPQRQNTNTRSGLFYFVTGQDYEFLLLLLDGN